jgi:intracellular sulfur oxidation DsrE/DsrF family protein
MSKNFSPEMEMTDVNRHLVVHLALAAEALILVVAHGPGVDVINKMLVFSFLT